MTDLADALRDLVAANHILAHEHVLDGYGHVSIRHPTRPDRFFLSCSRSPELVGIDDIMEFDLECQPVDPRGRTMYFERPIHGAAYQTRADVNAVIHNHAYEVIPFSITNVPIRPTAIFTSGIGKIVPVWDIRTKFGNTNGMVVTMEQGRDLAMTQGQNNTALLRGHGAVVTGASLQEAVITALYLMVNARIQMDAMRLGDVTFLNDEEVELGLQQQKAGSIGYNRVWEYLKRRSGVAL